jgi:hypothetical protein
MALAYLTKLRSKSELAIPRVDQPDPAIKVEVPRDQRFMSAQAILDAGQRRRGEIPDAAPEPGTHAAEVLKLLKASRRARGIQED